MFLRATKVVTPEMEKGMLKMVAQWELFLNAIDSSSGIGGGAKVVPAATAYDQATILELIHAAEERDRQAAASKLARFSASGYRCSRAAARKEPGSSSLLTSASRLPDKVT